MVLQTTHERIYDDKEDLFRRQLWETNVAAIEAHNKEFEQGKHTFTLGENLFSDRVRLN